jgi:hypothetical protein
MITRNNDGEIIFSAVDDRDELVSALKEILASTSVGQDYKKNYHTKDRSDEDGEKIVAAAIQIAGGPMISSRHLQHALTLLIDSGEIQPRVAVQSEQISEPEPDTRPRGRDGKVLTESQLRYQEFRVWSEAASSDERKRRMSSDPNYASYVRKSYQAEMTHEIDGAVTPAGEPDKKIKVNAELMDFVHRYNRTPSDAIKPRGGYVHLVDAPPMLYSTFIQLVERAAQARLL